MTAAWKGGKCRPSRKARLSREGRRGAGSARALFESNEKFPNATRAADWRSDAGHVISSQWGGGSGRPAAL